MNISNKAKIIGLITIIAVLILANFFIFYTQKANLNTETTSNTLIGVYGQPVTITETMTSASAAYDPIFFFSVTGFLLFLIVILVIFAIAGDKKAKKKDQQRKEDLEMIAKGFEKFYELNQFYPVSQKYANQHYTVVNFNKDWEYFAFPPDDYMRKFIPGWPIDDPDHQPNKPDQVNAYLYYPKEDGQKFDLYAHLQKPGKNAVDYNQVDQISTSLGQYNYKVSSKTSNEVQEIIEANSPTATMQFVSNPASESSTSTPQFSPENSMVNLPLPTPVTNNPIDEPSSADNSPAATETDPYNSQN